MKPNKLTVYQLFETKRRYVVPLFQRPYVWKSEEQWQPLWEDVKSKANQVLNREGNDDIGTHFLGAAVISLMKTYGVAVQAFEIIDGQQRLTTLQILLVAFRHFLKAIKFPDTGLDYDLGQLTVNSGSRSQEIEKYKVWPTIADQSTYETVFTLDSVTEQEDDNNEQENDNQKEQLSSPLLTDAYHFFYGSIAGYVISSDGDGEAVLPIDAKACHAL